VPFGFGFEQLLAESKILRCRKFSFHNPFSSARRLSLLLKRTEYAEKVFWFDWRRGSGRLMRTLAGIFHCLWIMATESFLIRLASG
jgi:hypothetical protein